MTLEFAEIFGDDPDLLKYKPIWDMCRKVCANLCREHAQEYRVDESLKVYTGMICGKVCNRLAEIIDSQDVLQLSEKDARIFFEMMSAEKEPNEALKRAFEEYKKARRVAEPETTEDDD
jgi:hypothetical protein